MLERLKKDLEYINSISVKNDLFIIFRTIINVIKRKDIAVGREHNMS